VRARYFVAALVAHLPRPGDVVAVALVLDELAPRPASEVVHDLVAGSAPSATAATDLLNSFDVLIVQHEYAIHRSTDGQDELLLLEALYAPTIVVLPHSRCRADA
jgi:polysaccharide biosynthesis protein PslF